MSLHYKHIQSLFNLHYTDLCNKSYWYVKDVEKSKDIVQEVFLSLLEKKKLDHINDLKGYLYKSVINNSIKQFDKQKRFISFEKNTFNRDYTENSIENTIITSENKEEVISELNQLPEKCKEIFILCVLEGVSYKDAAYRQEISINTVKSQIKKGYKILRSSLKSKIVMLHFFTKKDFIKNI
ncbi:MAG: sigma-70 family RNA polymerase sigma factor [Galbibacter orientalis]|uniref:RNA polymerase sigma factor n=1 Tax=Galbibacter orientalis TaxID=453852 RepID=UPI0030033FD8